MSRRIASMLLGLAALTNADQELEETDEDCTVEPVSGNSMLQTLQANGDQIKVIQETLLKTQQNETGEVSGRRRKCSVTEAGKGCSVFKKCCDGLSCHPGKQKCYNVPRQWGEPCSAGFGCGENLFCKAVVHKCVHLENLYDPCAKAFDPNSQGCGCFQPTCVGSALCTCMLVPAVVANCGKDFPCESRAWVPPPIDHYTKRGGRSAAGGYLKMSTSARRRDNERLLDCCPDGTMTYTHGLYECTEECDKSEYCKGFDDIREDKQCVFKHYIQNVQDSDTRDLYEKNEE